MIIKAYNNQLKKTDITLVAKTLQKGGIIIYPTDSVYAFACLPEQQNTIEKICLIRKIPTKQPKLTLICKDIAQARQYTLFSDDTFKLIKAHTPGPYTFILQGNNRLPKALKGRKTVGIRIANHPIPTTIIEETQSPLITASLRAPINNDIEYMTDPELMAEMYPDIDIIIDAGIGQTTPSTIIDCTEEEPIILRQGNGEITL